MKDQLRYTDFDERTYHVGVKRGETLVTERLLDRNPKPFILDSGTIPISIISIFYDLVGHPNIGDVILQQVQLNKDVQWIYQEEIIILFLFLEIIQPHRHHLNNISRDLNSYNNPLQNQYNVINRIRSTAVRKTNEFISDEMANLLDPLCGEACLNTLIKIEIKDFHEEGSVWNIKIVTV
ncbi:hypothetical protein C1645_831595 [Glomus cerebriforme]|uniref:Uncharacterized protein n=1 Tax=Glomus cerebriforme TaxID=658196 RepID=A0A397SLC5_9GLOM|nr:hypothetical protein C1645_831595 [Glomus cerebriforme]